ncbi:MAG: ribulokinase [Anaerolineales bacterium]|nr:ribulokinase [Anaerolineales bacterium]
MSRRKYAIGLDFGTESGRAVLVDVRRGRELATAVYPYPHGVIDRALPVDGRPVRLWPDWALQDPADYIRTFQRIVPAVLRQSGIDPADVIGLGIDFTACTMLPVLADGTPLCTLPEYRRNPHAWVKLWKHHAAQPQADRINASARALGERWIDRYGGKISSEWFISKALQILDEAPEIYQAASRLVEAADWAVWQLTGQELRNACTAGYAAMGSKRDGTPSAEFFAAVNPRLPELLATKLSANVVPIGGTAGGLTAQAARWTGLLPGTPVAVPIIDSYACVPAATVTGPDRMVSIMGTSNTLIVLGEEEKIVPGIAGFAEDGVIPGLFAFAAGQSAVGDSFAWFVANAVPPPYHAAAHRRKLSVHQWLEAEAAQHRPGESGLLALDWWNGNRSVLVDADLSGLVLGATLATRPPELYRALIEATAFGTRVIIESFEGSGITVNELIACGGLPERSRLLMQIYADVTGRELKVTAAPQTSALGAAMLGAVAAGQAQGGYASLVDAAPHMARLKPHTYRPEPQAQKVYEQLYREYLTLHDYFGRGGNDVLKRLKRLKTAGRAER